MYVAIYTSTPVAQFSLKNKFDDFFFIHDNNRTVNRLIVYRCDILIFNITNIKSFHETYETDTWKITHKRLTGSLDEHCTIKKWYDFEQQPFSYLIRQKLILNHKSAKSFWSIQNSWKFFFYYFFWYEKILKNKHELKISKC